jgi:protein-tyrosine phosphatase
MNHLFWIIPNHLAGRPGPDEEPWDLQAFHQMGIRAIVSVNDGRLCNPQELETLGMAYACFPLSDWVPPQPGDLELCLSTLPTACAFVQSQLSQRRKVVVHCSGGNDRTGLCLGYFLVRYRGFSPKQALQTLRGVRSTILSAEGWEPFAQKIWLNAV